MLLVGDWLTSGSCVRVLAEGVKVCVHAAIGEIDC